VYNTTTVGDGLGFNANRLLAWGLGYVYEVFIPIEVLAYVTPGGGGGAQRRTYLFLPRDIRFNVKLEGSIMPPVESTFLNPEDVVKGKVSARREPLLVKAFKRKNGNN